jgi:transcriptional regulator with XRE-family HTH domain
MTFRGYSYKLVEANLAADLELIGVQLGRWCIANDISVDKIAKKFKVSRMTIYSWFIGKSQPHSKNIQQIKKYLGY